MRTLATAVLCTALSGCMNLCVRAPWTGARIERVYQQTLMAAGGSILVMYPQLMSGSGDGTVKWWNCLTVPLGCVCFCDAICEACVDTICLPVDWPLASSRDKGD